MGCTHTTYIKVENILQPDIAVPLLIRLIYDNALSFHSRFLTLPGNFLGCRAIKFSLSIIQVYQSSSVAFDEPFSYWSAPKNS